MKIVFAVGLLLAACTPALAQERPTAQKCASVYGAFAQEQTTFGASNSLMGERYFNYVKINFAERLESLARKSEMGVTELKSSSAVQESDYYMKLVDAETDGDMDVLAVREMIRLSDTCDAEYGFNPSMGS